MAIDSRSLGIYRMMMNITHLDPPPLLPEELERLHNRLEQFIRPYGRLTLDHSHHALVLLLFEELKSPQPSLKFQPKPSQVENFVEHDGKESIPIEGETEEPPFDVTETPQDNQPVDWSLVPAGTPIGITTSGGTMSGEFMSIMKSGDMRVEMEGFRGTQKVDPNTVTLAETAMV
jgi:hypothetical protein